MKAIRRDGSKATVQAAMSGTVAGVLALLASAAVVAEEPTSPATNPEAAEFGLFISQWREQKARVPYAPGMIDEKLVPIDPRTLRLQKQARRALADE